MLMNHLSLTTKSFSMFGIPVMLGTYDSLLKNHKFL